MRAGVPTLPKQMDYTTISHLQENWHAYTYAFVINDRKVLRVHTVGACARARIQQAALEPASFRTNLFQIVHTFTQR